MMQRLRLGKQYRRIDAARGAAAVEFALVSSVLFPVLFGILQYGLYFNASLEANQAVREAARRAVVQNSTAACGGASGWAAITCEVEDAIGASDANTFVKVSAPEGWDKGKPLHVCVLVRSGSASFLPMPHDGFVRADLQMSIEEESPTPSGAGAQETPPAGQGWDWC